jgi:hypothetical protein
VGCQGEIREPLKNPLGILQKNKRTLSIYDFSRSLASLEFWLKYYNIG